MGRRRAALRDGGHVVTGDNITDKQIHAFHERSDDDVHEICRVALYAPFGSMRRATARAKIAELLNAEVRK